MFKITSKAPFSNSTNSCNNNFNLNSGEIVDVGVISNKSGINTDKNIKNLLKTKNIKD